MAWHADLQQQFDAVPGGRNVILNGVDTTDTANLFNPTGVAGVMLDHWSILQFLLRGRDAGCNDASNMTAVCGHFNATGPHAH